VVFVQVLQIFELEHVTKTEVASRVKTSRASLDRMLDRLSPSAQCGQPWKSRRRSSSLSDVNQRATTPFTAGQERDLSGQFL
jgi:hypothetical protein